MQRTSDKPARVTLPLFLLFLIVIFLAFPAYSDNVTIPYRQENHGSFEEEWAPHEDVFGWWYLTGMLHDEENSDLLYAYQYTVFHLSAGGAEKIKQMDLSRLPSAIQFMVPFLPTTHDSYIYSLTLIDLQTGQRLTELRPYFGEDSADVYANGDTVSFMPQSILTRGENSMTLSAGGTGMQLALDLQMGKGATWHGDNGVLVMSCPNIPEARTVYYSYPNMPTTGTMNFTNEVGQEVDVQVVGQSWFDRQWGPLGLDSGGTFWEWFSLRFFDAEEVMLFAFPQTGYRGATYIGNNGDSGTFSDYTYTPEELWKNASGHTFSWVWDLTMPDVKNEHYLIVPMIDKLVDEQLELGMWMEIPAKIFNDNHELVGYAFVELVNGARDEMEGDLDDDGDVDGKDLSTLAEHPEIALLGDFAGNFGRMNCYD